MLVRLSEVIPGICIDLKYASVDNFTGRVIYPFRECYLHRDAAEALKKAQLSLQNQGLGLKVWDGYRPMEAQKILWQICPDERYVANPEKGSNHTRGVAVDVTLVDKEGQELKMPTRFDDFTVRAAAQYEGSEREALRNRSLLQSAMTEAGFEMIETEWWHFAIRGWERYPMISTPPPLLQTTAFKN
jgi:D-alanyl-D-alanine dipeptidase